MISKIEIKNLTHQLEDGQIVFENINVKLPTNEIVFFEGGGGSARSTLLKMMAGLAMPGSGSIHINDLQLSELTFEEFLPTRLKIGYSFEFGGLLNNRTIRENLLLPIRYHSLVSAEEGEKRVDELIARFELKKVAHLRPSSASGSQRKACIVARAFVMKPELVLLDEPFAGLTSAAIHYLKKFIVEEMKTGNLKHVFLSCQNSRDVAGWATIQVLIENHEFAVLPIINDPTHQGAA